MLKADGFDDCILGTVERCGKPPHLVYDAEKVVAKLVSRDGMSWDEAQEFFEFNIAGAWVGEGTPGYLYPYDPEEGE